MPYSRLTSDTRFTLMNERTNLYLDANSKGEVYALTPNGGTYQRWKAVEHSGPGKDGVLGEFSFIQHATGNALDGSASHKKSVYTNPYNGGDYQRWIAIWDPRKGAVRLRHKQSNKLLDSNADGDVYLLDENGGPYQAWCPFAADLAWVATAQILFDPVIWPEVDPLLAEKGTVSNSGPGQVEQKLDYSYKESSSFTWSLTETLEVSTTVELSIGIPGAIGTKYGLKLSLNLSSTQSQTKTIDMEYELGETITVPPFTDIDWSWWLTMAPDMEFPYTLYARMQATEDGHYKSGEDLARLLEGQGTLTETGTDYVVIALRGNLVGDVGFQSDFKVEESTTQVPAELVG
jgi:hypothetical protein